MKQSFLRNKEPLLAFQPRGGDRGFALVIAISLMVLLTVLAIGLLTLSTVSLRASSQGEAMQAARSNARMALSLAIGQLQKNAGADQRITAPAMIAESSAPSWLTGVWSGALPTAQDPVPEKDGQFRGYLSSGAGAAASPAPSDLPDLASGAVLMGEGSLGKDADPASWVRAPKVESPGAGGSLDGRYAWSVLDEGTKAKADVVRKEGRFGNANHQAALGSAPRFGMESIKDFGGFDWFEGSEQAKLYTLPTSDLIQGMPELKKHQHDVTTVHRGLVTDAARGGLRKDLSLLFNGTTLPSDYADQRIYDDETVLTDVPNPYWSQAFEYATMYRELAGPDPVLKAKVPPAYNPVKYDPRSRSYKANPQAPKGLLLMPVVAKVQMQFSMVCQDAHGFWSGGLDGNDATGEDNFMVYLIYSPIVTLYNPYNMAISFDQMKIDFKDLPIGLRFYRNGQPQTSTLAHFNQLYIYHPDNSNTPKTFSINLKSAFTGGSAPVLLQPGENKVFGESVSGDWSWNSNAGSFFDYEDKLTSNINLAPGYPSPGCGFWIDWLTPQNIKTSFDDSRGILPIKKTDSIDVGYGPLPSSASGNRLSIELSLMRGSQKIRSGTLDLDYGDANRLRSALSRDPAHDFPDGEARLERPFTGAEMYQSPGDKLKDFIRVKPFAQFSFYAKTTLEADSPSKPWVQGAHATSMVAIDLAKESMGVHPYEASFKRVPPSYRFPIDVNNRGKFFTGHGVENSSLNGNSIAPQYEIPMLPLQSLAQLRHAQLSNQGFLPGATYTVGESFATAMIPKSGVAASGTKSYRLLDHAWLANNALWDGYYFSTLGSQSGPLMGSRSAETVAGEFLEGKVPLLNPRMVPAGNAVVSEAVSELSAADGYRKSAAHLMIDGAFNVNSTSADAWAAFLGSLNKEDVEYSHIGMSGAAPVAGIKQQAAFPFSRMRRANGPPVEEAPGLLQQQRHARWTGMRTLTEDQIRELAQHVVEEIKERGPFLSLAEFVNRQPQGDSEKALKGILQAAIDETESINAGFRDDSEMNAVADMAADHYAFPDALAGMSATGAPGFLTQGDLLSSLGPVISVRSDTFRIRGYGEALDPDQNVVARAWCEAVVQRMPEFVDPEDAPGDDIASLNDVNKRFGRRYTVTGFRWLSQDEV